jgi:hypothetical protein
MLSHISHSVDTRHPSRDELCIVSDEHAMPGSETHHADVVAIEQDLGQFLLCFSGAITEYGESPAACESGSYDPLFGHVFEDHICHVCQRQVTRFDDNLVYILTKSSKPSKFPLNSSALVSVCTKDQSTVASECTFVALHDDPNRVPNATIDQLKGKQLRRHGDGNGGSCKMRTYNQVECCSSYGWVGLLAFLCGHMVGITHVVARHGMTRLNLCPA